MSAMSELATVLLLSSIDKKLKKDTASKEEDKALDTAKDIANVIVSLAIAIGFIFSMILVWS
ncbi:hypothetical protein PT447_00130 [Aliarcobacter butzleri]|uniref:hypothetical protein n=1 Tax=Aliarcobacter butzleri TaxID=28197 RepID=UPI0024DE7B60|nr:hypothetical protein [Aliarcobacter butzleri]MDK2063326.1 hypothetical protein [Aliarcobacter butzleri]